MLRSPRSAPRSQPRLAASAADPLKSSSAGGLIPPLSPVGQDRYFSDLPETPLLLPSIGSERKTHFLIRRRFFDPGVCSRSGWAVSSGDFVLVAPLEQRRNRYEWLGLMIRFEGNLIASRFVGVCALHGNVGTILPSGPLPAIASLGSSEGHSLS